MNMMVAEFDGVFLIPQGHVGEIQGTNTLPAGGSASWMQVSKYITRFRTRYTEKYTIQRINIKNSLLGIDSRYQNEEKNQ